MSAPEHVTTVTKVGVWGECSPTCTCGWTGKTTNRGAANDEADAHVSKATAVCPECRNGKHGNCPGEAWDDVADTVTDCTCTDGSHR